MLVGASALQGATRQLAAARVPISEDRSSYSPLIVLVVIVAVVLLTIRIVRRF